MTPKNVRGDSINLANPERNLITFLKIYLAAPEKFDPIPKNFAGERKICWS